jgi:hypothetical protein
MGRVFIFGSSPKELLMHKLMLFASKRKPQAFFYLSPFVPPLHFMERGIGGEVFEMSVSLSRKEPFCYKES